MATSLSSPGVEVREIDNSLRVSTNGGTTVYIPGFASQGPVEEVVSITSITDFEQIFGIPTNAAERYFYYTVLAVLNNSSSSTSVLVSRLPYGEGEGDTVSHAFTLLAYPAAPVKAHVEYTVDSKSNKITSPSKSYDLNKKGEQIVYTPGNLEDGQSWGKKVSGNKVVENNITYIIGEPTSFQISLKEYYKILTDVLFPQDDSNSDENWSDEAGEINTWNDLRKAAFIVINKSRSTINESLEGLYFGLNDSMFNEPLNLYKVNDSGDANTAEPLTLYDNIKSIKIANNINDEDHSVCGTDKYQIINENNLDFDLTGSNQGSISKVMQKDMSTYTTDNPELDDVLSCALFKLTKSSSGNKAFKLNFNVKENYNFSLGESRITSSVKTTAPVSLYAPTVTKNSNDIVITVNPHIARTVKVDIEGNVFGRIRIGNEKLLEKLHSISVADAGVWVESNDEASGEETEDAPKKVSSKKASKAEPVDKGNFVDTVIRAGIDYDQLKAILNIDNNCELLNESQIEPITWIKPCQSVYSFGTYRLDKKANNFIGSVPMKLTRALTLIENDEEYPDVDIVCEAGLGTIYTYSNLHDQISSSKDGLVELWRDANNEDAVVDYNAGDLPGDKWTWVASNFVESTVLKGVEDLRSGRSSINDNAIAVKDKYMSIQNVFLNFANSYANGGRGDVFYLPDLLRGIAIRGLDTKVENLYGTQIENSIYTEDDKVNHSWATSIYAPIKHLYDSFTSSFAAVYATMFKIEDLYTNKMVWVPASGYIAANFAAADAIGGPWLAGAGLNRGIVQGIQDTAINPSIRQRDDLYKISINAVPKIANVGSVIYGIRTMVKKPTTFDQVTCRRTALLLGKTMKKYLRYYVFEPNTTYTRLCIYNDLQPYLESIKAAGGIYNYRLVTDESVNTADIINNGEMAVECAIQYTRTAEFITLTMIAEKYVSTVNFVES